MYSTQSYEENRSSASTFAGVPVQVAPHSLGKGLQLGGSKLTSTEALLVPPSRLQ
ncbi:hypothetical protein HMPREF1556_00736 [Porphyromonas sp. oral taxon 278 str. W7784]|nr:hypothetical protein HMPREF1556_00736 [Porphyromonas sp. oral taxon 278 str. W7784]